MISNDGHDALNKKIELLSMLNSCSVSFNVHMLYSFVFKSGVTPATIRSRMFKLFKYYE